MPFLKIQTASWAWVAVCEPGHFGAIFSTQRTISPLGIFVLHYGLGLVVKKIEPIPNTSPITLRMFSNNNAYSAYDRSIDEVRIIGRLVWFARTI